MAPIDWVFAAGTFAMAGDFAADSAALDPSMLAGVTEPLEAAAKTPIGPIATAIGGAISRTARNFNAAGTIRVVNFPGGGAVRIDSADVIGPGGARARVSGGSGVTYYWPRAGSGSTATSRWRAAACQRPGLAAPARSRRADERGRRVRALHRAAARAWR